LEDLTDGVNCRALATYGADEHPAFATRQIFAIDRS
jgi:hypothetical protein